MAKVAIFMGSASDEAVMRPAADLLNAFGVPNMFTVSSAHRTPERTEKLVAELEEDGCHVYICGAGMAAHLAGAVAARTNKPVIGVPLSGKNLGGMDALLATVQMPSGFPVATVAVDGAKNAAYLAMQILALHDSALAQKLANERQGFKDAVEKAAAAL